MRRADRLFQIIQALRRARGPVTAEVLAVELETSKRTIYRDVADLMGQRVPIRGEAGFGYVLDSGFDMPPLMLTHDEIEAAVLGAQWVAARGDPELARAANDLIAKIAATVPEGLRPFVVDPALTVRPSHRTPPDGLDLGRLRSWIRQGRKIVLSYRDEQGRETGRTIWPVALGFQDATRLIAAWCEMRQDFRHFRSDRVAAAEFLEERYPTRPSVLRAEWRRTFAEQRKAYEAGARSAPS